ncbi:MAG: DEAD/DEAH box helicase family protein [bacterium]
MNKTAQIISNRLSLRKPQEESLDILSIIANELSLQKEVELEKALNTINNLYKTCSSFERSFPSICFSLATGVGKTRLMGAFITYLYLEKDIKNFFVLAPNLTIYQKLIDDLSKPENHKYVFKGIAEFINTPPRVITGDNYNQAQIESLWGESIKINIFNISKINSEVRGGREAKIKRLSEYLGDSYFNYLSSLPDLVLLMDESHHYRADSGMNAINELKPILGLELTATPIDSKGNKFKNVVYDYPLALALNDAFVKVPAIATRKNFNPDQYRNDPKELDILKLEDGIRIHEDTKVALDIYSRNTGNKLVKPFVLVVAKDTDHANEIREIIESERFFKGRYKGKVMEIHSNQRGEEKEENIQRLVDLEKPNNQIEIVVHVNMLKEGWDVTNLYTIIPLRASASVILTEQTLGRGLRLPYGKRTGEHKVDTLTVVAHDKFNTIIEEANKPDSLIKKENIIEIDPSALPERQEVIVSSPTFISEVTGSFTDYTLQPRQTVVPVFLSDSQKVVVQTINNLSRTTKSINDLTSSDVQKIAFQKIVEEVENNPQPNLFKEQIIEQAQKEYKSIAQSYIEKVIPIPRVILQQSNEVKTGFKDFELDISNLNYQPLTDEILRKTLGTNENEIIAGNESGLIRDLPENIIVNELINDPQVDYDRDADLLFKLVKTAVKKLAKDKTEKELRNIVLYHKKDIALFIFSQMSLQFFVSQGEYQEPEVYPFTQIESHNFAKFTKDKIHSIRETINPLTRIPSIVFGGYKKACHDLYKFDSKSEKDFAIILEDDKHVLKWLRPAFNQFSIYWNNNSKRYEPDFVVETENIIYMVEVKKESDIEDDDVQQKARAAMKYCEVVNKFSQENNGKQWIYAIIPHNRISFNMDLLTLLNN